MALHIPAHYLKQISVQKHWQLRLHYYFIDSKTATYYSHIYLQTPLLCCLRLLLHQLEPPWRPNATGSVLQQPQLSMGRHVLPDESGDQHLWPVLPLHHDLLGSHHLVTLQPIQQSNAHDRTTNARLVGQCCECGALHLDIDHTCDSEQARGIS